MDDRSLTTGYNVLGFFKQRATCRGCDVIVFEVMGLQRTWGVNSRASPAIFFSIGYISDYKSSNHTYN